MFRIHAPLDSLATRQVIAFNFHADLALRQNLLLVLILLLLIDLFVILLSKVTEVGTRILLIHLLYLLVIFL